MRKNPIKGLMQRCTWKIGILTALLIVGMLFSWWLVQRADRDLRDELQRNALLISQALDAVQIESLPFKRDDRLLPAFQQSNQQMRQLTSTVRISWSPANRHVSIYTMKLVNGVIRFGPESIPENAPMASPPGTVYKNPPPELGTVFSTRNPVVVGPFTDEYGTFVSAFVPLSGTAPGSSHIVVGVDIMAGNWTLAVLQKAAVPIGLVVVLLTGVTAVLFSARPVDASPKPVTWRLMPALACMLILLMAGGGALLYHQYQRQLAKDIASDTAVIDEELRTALAQQANGLGAALRAIAADPSMQKALREGNSDRLMTGWRPLFETLRRENRVTHFYLLDPNRICLLRLHKPEKRGDRIDRFTALQAERTGKTASGIELGPLGTFTLRVVQPVFERGTLVGYVELGKEIEDVLQTLHSHDRHQLVVVIRKAYLSRQAWEEGMRMLGHTANWGVMPRSVLIYPSQGNLPDALLSWVGVLTDDKVPGKTKGELKFDGKNWMVAVTHLHDVSGRAVGSLLCIHDISTEKANFSRLVTLGGTGGAVLLVMLLGGIYVLLRRTDAGIRAQQKALRESEQSYRNQFECNAAVMLLIDPTDGTLLDANAAATSFYGYPRERLLSMRITDINTLPPSRTLQIMASVSRGQGSYFQFQHRLADGSLRDVEVAASSIQFGGQSILHSIIHDITERKHAENMLNEQVYFVQQLLDSIPIPVFYKDSGGLYLGCNTAYETFIGLSRDQIVGKTVYDLASKELADVYHEADSALIRRTGIQVYETCVMHKDGTRYDVIFNKSTYLGADGRVAGIIGALIDITQRKRSEQEREQLIAQLQEALANVKQLSGMLPICASCKKIRDDKGYWQQIESYIRTHTEAEFTHGLCPTCAAEAYEEIKKMKKQMVRPAASPQRPETCSVTFTAPHTKHE